MSYKKSPRTAKAMLLDLVIGCPRGDYSVDCVLYGKRLLTLSEKHEWLMALSDDDLIDIYSAHSECLNSKDLFMHRQLLEGTVYR